MTIFGHFKGKSPKKIILEGFGEEKYKYFKPRPDIQQLTRLLLQIYVTIFGHFRGKSQKIWFYKALDGKNSSISSPDRIFNSWRGFYCIFKWQYFGILREEAKIENCKLVNRPWWGQTIQQSTLYFKLKPFLAWTLVSYFVRIYRERALMPCLSFCRRVEKI